MNGIDVSVIRIKASDGFITITVDEYKDLFQYVLTGHKENIYYIDMPEYRSIPVSEI